jgi:hypothetical protein
MENMEHIINTDIENANLNIYVKEDMDEIEDISIENKIAFKNLAKSYFNIDDDIRAAEQLIKTKKKERKELTEKILLFMKENEIDDLDTNKGILQYTVNERKIGLSKKVLQNKLLNFFDKEEDRALDLFKFLDNRETVEKVTLKVKKTKSKDDKKIVNMPID